MNSELAASFLKRAPRYLAGGIDPNDFNRIVANADTWDGWLKGIESYAQERKELAEAALESGRVLSAGEYFIESGLYYHFAQLGYFEDMDRKTEIKIKSISTYSLGLDLDVPPIRRLDIPYDGITMAAHLRLPPGEGPFPIVILLPGVDSTKEEYHSFSQVLLKRGLATLALEGPGQGETRFSRPMPDNYEIAFSAAIDFLDNIPEVDLCKMAVYGRSMGGYLAPRAAAYDHRIRALVSAGGIYEMSYWDSLATQTKQNFKHAWGCVTFEEARERAKKITLEGIITQISCPFLIIHSKKDIAFPASGAERMKSEAKCEAELFIYEDGTHVCDNIRYKYQRLVSDWLVEKLNGPVNQP